MNVTKLPGGLRQNKKRKDHKDIDGQMVKLNTALVKLGKAITVKGSDGKLKQLVFDVSKADIIGDMRHFPRISHMNMTTFACAYAYNATYGDERPSGEADDLAFLALMTTYTSTIDFDRPLDVNNSEYVRYKTDIVRYLVLISQQIK